jgi:hypothetical protein
MCRSLAGRSSATRGYSGRSAGTNRAQLAYLDTGEPTRLGRRGSPSGPQGQGQGARLARQGGEAGRAGGRARPASPVEAALVAADEDALHDPRCPPEPTLGVRLLA